MNCLSENVVTPPSHLTDCLAENVIPVRSHFAQDRKHFSIVMLLRILMSLSLLIMCDLLPPRPLRQSASFRILFAMLMFCISLMIALGVGFLPAFC